MLLLTCGIDSVTELARTISKSRIWTSDVLYGRRKSEATRLAILRAFHQRGLDLEYEDLWPSNGHKKAA